MFVMADRPREGWPSRCEPTSLRYDLHWSKIYRATQRWEGATANAFFWSCMRLSSNAGLSWLAEVLKLGRAVTGGDERGQRQGRATVAASEPHFLGRVVPRFVSISGFWVIYFNLALGQGSAGVGKYINHGRVPGNNRVQQQMYTSGCPSWMTARNKGTHRG